MIWSQLPIHETIITGIVAVSIWLVYTFFAFRKKLPVKELSLRSALLAISLVCLCLIICKPQYAVNQHFGKALVLTENATKIPDSIAVFALSDVETGSEVKKIPDFAFLERNFPETGQVYIAGYNTDPEALSQLKRIKINFLEKEPPPGFNWLSYATRIKEGESLKISGTFRNTAKDSVRLILETTEGRQDSVTFPAGIHRFSLQAYSQLTGNFTGKMLVRQNGKTRTEPLPYSVEPKTPLNILIVQDFPVFETNYLKEWLVRQKHQVQVQTRISREKYTRQAVNMPSSTTDMALLTVNTLGKADLLIIDEESLKQLTATQQNILRNAIKQGLGLLLLPDEKWLQQKEVLGYQFPVNATDVKQFQPKNALPKTSANAMTEKIPAAFVGNTRIVPVIKSNSQETVTAYLPVAQGRIGVQLATATFPWILNGEEKLYSAFWTDVIQSLSRRKIQKRIEIAENAFLWKNNRSVITVTDTDTNIQFLQVQYPDGRKQTIYPTVSLPDITAIQYPFRPVASGWVNMYLQNDTTQARQFYILPENAWKDLKQADWWQKNQKYQGNIAKESEKVFTTFKDIPSLWFFIIFLVAVGYLWWRERNAAS